MNQQASTGDNHPADTLGTALARATGVLNALTLCHDVSCGTIALNGQFLLQAILALEGFVNDANSAYFDLCNACDLSLSGNPHSAARKVFTPDPADFREEQAIFVPDIPPAPQSALPDLYSFRVPEAEPAQAIAKPSAAVEQPMSEIASSYDDLLRKLTAAEVFAAERGRARMEPDGPLLPLLKSLRQDIERFRAA